MAEKKNQHFVPKFYFRLFSNGRENINLVRRCSGQCILNAPIKGQCAENDFYGSKELENAFAEIEGRQATSIKRFTAAAISDASPFTEDDYYSLLNAVLFQRARTRLEAEKVAPAQERFALEAFRHHLATAAGIDNREEMLRVIDNGEFELRQSRQHAVLQSIDIHAYLAPLLTDLKLCALINCTQNPFVFSDSPVVFYNLLYRNVKNRGVLGITTPGLIVLFPVSSLVTLMLVDERAYGGPHQETDVIEITERRDIAFLNLAQIHHSHSAFYFGNSQDSEYVCDLFNAHKTKLTTPRNELRKLRGWLVDGNPTDEVLQTIEPQIELSLQPTFLRCTPIAEHEFRFRRRSPELFQAYKDSCPDHFVT